MAGGSFTAAITLHLLQNFRDVLRHLIGLTRPSCKHRWRQGRVFRCARVLNTTSLGGRYFFSRPERNPRDTGEYHNRGRNKPYRTFIAAFVLLFLFQEFSWRGMK